MESQLGWSFDAISFTAVPAMTDLTPQDVRNKSGGFRRTVRGYDPGEVDAFLRLVADCLRTFASEKENLLERTRTLEERLVELEERESTIQETLMFAHKVSEQTIARGRDDAEALREQASRDADLMKAEAEAEAARRIEEVEGLLRDRRKALGELERVRVLFLRSFKKLLETEITTVELEAARKPLEGITLGLELEEWVPSSETPVNTEAGSEGKVGEDYEEPEMGGTPRQKGSRGEGEVPIFEVHEGITEDVAAEGGTRRGGAFDYMVTSIKEEELPELFGRVLDDGPDDRENPSLAARAEEDGEEDT
jgi:cell division initiation protein